jgi:hypothetical protein
MVICLPLSSSLFARRDAAPAGSIPVDESLEHLIEESRRQKAVLDRRRSDQHGGDHRGPQRTCRLPDRPTGRVHHLQPGSSSTSSAGLQIQGPKTRQERAAALWAALLPSASPIFKNLAQFARGWDPFSTPPLTPGPVLAELAKHTAAV